MTINTSVSVYKLKHCSNHFMVEIFFIYLFIYFFIRKKIYYRRDMVDSAKLINSTFFHTMENNYRCAANNKILLNEVFQHNMIQILNKYIVHLDQIPN